MRIILGTVKLTLIQKLIALYNIQSFSSVKKLQSTQTTITKLDQMLRLKSRKSAYLTLRIHNLRRQQINSNQNRKIQPKESKFNKENINSE